LKIEEAIMGNYHRRIDFLLVLLIGLLLVACGNGISGPDGENGELTNDPQRGEELFKMSVIGPNSAPGCITCHSLEEGVTIVGPSMANVASRANSRIPEISSKEYLRESIIEPNAYIVDGFPEGVMYPRYANDLSENEVSNLVAFLLTLKTE
jgi:hypothetical protein